MCEKAKKYLIVPTSDCDVVSFLQEEIVTQTDYRSSMTDRPPTSSGGEETDRLHLIQTALASLQTRLEATADRPSTPGQLTEQVLEAVVERYTTSLLEAVAGLKAAVVAGTAASQPMLESLDRAKIPESLEKLGKNITLLGVKLDIGAAVGPKSSVSGAVKREAETTTSPPPPQQGNSDSAMLPERLSAELSELGKDLRSQLDDVHDMVANVETTTASTLAEIRAEMKVP